MKSYEPGAKVSSVNGLTVGKHGRTLVRGQLARIGFAVAVVNGDVGAALVAAQSFASTAHEGGKQQQDESCCPCGHGEWSSRRLGQAFRPPTTRISRLESEDVTTLNNERLRVAKDGRANKCFAVVQHPPFGGIEGSLFGCLNCDVILNYLFPTLYSIEDNCHCTMELKKKFVYKPGNRHGKNEFLFIELISIEKRFH